MFIFSLESRIGVNYAVGRYLVSAVERKVYGGIYDLGEVEGNPQAKHLAQRGGDKISWVGNSITVFFNSFAPFSQLFH